MGFNKIFGWKKLGEVKLGINMRGEKFGSENKFRPKKYFEIYTNFFSYVKSIYISESIHKVSRSNNNLESLN